jgi:hypothetical protein
VIYEKIYTQTNTNKNPFIIFTTNYQLRRNFTQTLLACILTLNVSLNLICFFNKIYNMHELHLKININESTNIISSVFLAIGINIETKISRKQSA